MAREKLPRKELGRTAKFYRDNPKAREKKAKYDSKPDSPERKKKNAETRKYRRNNGLEGKGGPDIHHGKNGLMKISASKNRAIK